MDLTDFRLSITIGGKKVERAPLWSIQSERHVALGRASLILQDANGEFYRTLKKGDTVAIRYGYGAESAAWNGHVTSLGPGRERDQLEVMAADGALPLSRVRLVQSWENDSPELIVKWAIRQTGLPVGRVDSLGVVLPHFAACNIPVWQLARQASQTCQTAFALDMSRWALWLGAAGVNWGDFDEPGEVVAIGDRLIDHRPDGWELGRSVIEAHPIPGLGHSRVVRLQDTKRGLDLSARALKVRHEGVEGKVRTFIWYGKERG